MNPNKPLRSSSADPRTHVLNRMVESDMAASPVSDDREQPRPRVPRRGGPGGLGDSGEPDRISRGHVQWRSTVVAGFWGDLSSARFGWSPTRMLQATHGAGCASSWLMHGNAAQSSKVRSPWLPLAPCG